MTAETRAFLVTHFESNLMDHKNNGRGVLSWTYTMATKGRISVNKCLKTYFFTHPIQESRMVTIVIVIVFLFIVCQSFKLVPDVYEVFQCATGKR